MTATPLPTRNLKRWLLTLILFLAAFLRLHRIADLPPGDGYDPAWYGVDALEILDGHLPVYFPTNIGREALFSYLVAASVALVGVGPHAIHLAAAVVGILTVLTTYLVAEAFFQSAHEPLRTYGGLVSALALTVSFWHQHWSRYGVRAILVPLFTTLTLWTLARMLRAPTPLRRTAYAAMTGGCLGLSLYTYQSARVLPILVGLIALIETARRHNWSKRTAGDLLLLTGIATLIFTPMGAYLLRHPGVGNERISQTWAITPEQSLRENARAIWSEAQDAVRVLAIEGDNEIIHSLPGRPAMNAFLLAIAALGALWALAHLTRWPYWGILLWLPAMSVTVVLTLGGQPTKRALGALPAIAILIAVGALTPLALLQRRRHDHHPARNRALATAWIIILTAGFLYSAVATYRDYFLIWGQGPTLWTDFEGGRVAIGHYAGTLPESEVVYSSPEMPDHPSIVFNSGGRTDLRGYNGRLCAVFPAVTQAPTTYIIVPHDESHSLESLRAVYPEGVEVPAGPDYYGQPYFTAYRLPAEAEAHIIPQFSAPTNWGEGIQFLGFDAATTATAGEPLALTLYLKSLSGMERDYVLFVHLMNADGMQNPANDSALWAQDDSEPCRGFYPTSRWHPGEIIRDTYTLHIPADAPAGAYHLQMGFYTWPDFQRLTTIGPDGASEIAATFGTIEVRQP